MLVRKVMIISTNNTAMLAPGCGDHHGAARGDGVGDADDDDLAASPANAGGVSAPEAILYN
jgi:hypothetical protein